MWSLVNTKTVMLTCHSSTSPVYNGKILKRSPRNLARYAVISPATMLKSFTFLERMSWMISRKPFPNSSCEEPSSGLAPKSTRILSSARVIKPRSACDPSRLSKTKGIQKQQNTVKERRRDTRNQASINAPLKQTLLKC